MTGESPEMEGSTNLKTPVYLILSAVALAVVPIAPFTMHLDAGAAMALAPLLMIAAVVAWINFWVAALVETLSERYKTGRWQWTLRSLLFLLANAIGLGVGGWATVSANLTGWREEATRRQLARIEAALETGDVNKYHKALRGAGEAAHHDLRWPEHQARLFVAAAEHPAVSAEVSRNLPAPGRPGDESSPRVDFVSLARPNSRRSPRRRTPTSIPHSGERIAARRSRSR